MTFRCKMCGGALEIGATDNIATCNFCGTKQTLPRLDNDRKVTLYDRAGHFLRGNEYDKAVALYEQILSEDSTDAEAYWSIILCKYGVAYVEDPVTRRRIPTCNRTQVISILADGDYKKAIEHSDGISRSLYEEEARAIDSIQKGILEISNKEEPFDVFICYKETGDDGKRTKDSVRAQEMYQHLTDEGNKVFFSRITLEGKLGQQYEPYIFAALNSAKVMLAVGIKQSHFNAVWVKNEWSRFLSLMKKDKGKTLIPCFQDMDVYDLPDELAMLQSQDMSKLGFMQDLTRGVAKIVRSAKPETPKAATAATPAATVAPGVESLMRRGWLFLEDADWKQADDYFNKVLDIVPEHAPAYVGKLCAELKICKEEQLAQSAKSFLDYGNYKKAVRFAAKDYGTQIERYLKIVLIQIFQRYYTRLLQVIEKASTEKEYQDLAIKLRSINGYENIFGNLADDCEIQYSTMKENRLREKYDQLIQLKNTASSEEDYRDLSEKFRQMDGYENSNELAHECMKQYLAMKKFRESEEQRQREEEQRKQKEAAVAMAERQLAEENAKATTRSVGLAVQLGINAVYLILLWFTVIIRTAWLAGFWGAIIPFSVFWLVLFVVNRIRLDVGEARDAGLGLGLGTGFCISIVQGIVVLGWTFGPRTGAGEFEILWLILKAGVCFFIMMFCIGLSLGDKKP